MFDIPDVGRFGLLICYDIWFPKTVRTLAWLGAEVVLHPTLTTSRDRELELVLGQPHAITNQCYFVDINGVGPRGGYSQIIDPDGRVVQRAFRAGNGRHGDTRPRPGYLDARIQHLEDDAKLKESARQPG